MSWRSLFMRTLRIVWLRLRRRRTLRRIAELERALGLGLQEQRSLGIGSWDIPQPGAVWEVASANYVQFFPDLGGVVNHDVWEREMKVSREVRALQRMASRHGLTNSGALAKAMAEVAA